MLLELLKHAWKYMALVWAAFLVTWLAEHFL